MKTLVLAVIVVSTIGTGVLLAQTQAEKNQPAKPPSPTPAIQRTWNGFPKEPDRNFASLALAHAAYTEDFAKKPGFGSSRIMFLPGQDYVTVAGKAYLFSTPELVGLENEPVVYRRTGGVQNITVAIMSKAELRSRLTRRALTSVESNAVVQLRAGKDLVTHKEQVPVYALNGSESGHAVGIRAVGALRAQEGCAHCHGVKEGTLLGAFSYALTPTNLVAMSTPDTIHSTKPQGPQPRVTPPVGGTNLNITLSPNATKVLQGSLASVSGR